jgi:hypothetical protein
MSHSELPVPRRRFLVSALSSLGLVLSLGSLASISGCSDEKGSGQVADTSNIAKSESAQDSMKASMEQYMKRGNPAMPKKK